MATSPTPVTPLTPDEVTDIAESRVKRLSPVPRFGGAVPVCRFCHGPADQKGAQYCQTCVALWGLDQAQDPPLKIAPITLFCEYDEFDDWLDKYRGYPAEQQVTDDARITLAAVIGEFLRRHEQCFLGKNYKGLRPNLVTVPSAKHPSGTHPLRETLQRLPEAGPWFEADKLRGTAGLPEITPRDPRAAAGSRWYVPRGTVQGFEVLVVDDVWETGAHLHAAMSALKAVGANVLGAVVLGRMIDPSATTYANRLWKWSRDRRFTFEHCCWCPPEPEQPWQAPLFPPRFPPGEP